MRPFQSPGFRIYYGAQFMAFVGYWALEMARAFLALQVGGSAAALGSLLMALAIPSLLFSLHGGVVSDSNDTRKIIRICRSLLAISALCFFFLLKSGTELKLWMLYAFTFFEGCVMAYDSPAYMATLQRLVPQKDFKMAVVLQSTNFHLSRAAGPAIGGAIMSFYGVEYVFLFTLAAYMYIAFIIGKAKYIRNFKFETPVKESRKRFQGVQDILDAFKYFWGRKGLKYKLVQYFLTLSVLIPVIHVVYRSFLKFKFDLNGDEFGFLFSFPAAGAMTAAIIFIIVKYEDPIRNLRFAVPVLSLLVLAMAFVPNTKVAAILLALTGLFQYFTVNSITQSLHFQIDEQYRGRLGSIISLSFGAVMPLMSYPFAAVADKYGYRIAMLGPLCVFVLGSLFLAIKYGKLKFMAVPARRKRDKERIPETTSNPLQ